MKKQCDCLKKTEEAVKKQFVEHVEASGKKIHELIDNSESGFQCKGLMFSGGGGWQFALPMEYKYILEKSDGTPEKRTSTYKTNLLPSFCPICGNKISK